MADMAGHFHLALEVARKRLGRHLLPASRTSALIHLAALRIRQELPGLTVAPAWDTLPACETLLMDTCEAVNNRPAQEFVRKAMS